MYFRLAKTVSFLVGFGVGASLHREADRGAVLPLQPLTSCKGQHSVISQTMGTMGRHTANKCRNENTLKNQLHLSFKP
jgi:hypothetical protein